MTETIPIEAIFRRQIIDGKTYYFDIDFGGTKDADDEVKNTMNAFSRFLTNRGFDIETLNSERRIIIRTGYS